MSLEQSLGFDQKPEQIRAQTYPQWADQAAGMYRRLGWHIDQLLPEQQIDFGDVALDIGGRDGRFGPVIRALGPSYVVTIDPNAAKVEQGVAAGLISPYEAWSSTLEQWADLGREPADSAFLFAMQPERALDEAFLRAIPRAVRAGGLVVTSCLEAATAFSFWNATARHKWTGLELLKPSGPQPPAPARTDYLHIWRRRP